MFWVLILTSVIDLPQCPPLPSTYGQWQGYYYYPFDVSPSLTDKTPNKQMVNNNASLPYLLSPGELHYFISVIDSPTGQTHYCPDSLYSQFPCSRKEWGYIFINWTPHRMIMKDSLISFLMPVNFVYEYGYYTDVAIDTTGPDTLTVSGKKSYRLRGRWWNGQCDRSMNEIGSFTTYFIPTDKYDFRITCRSFFYYYSTGSEGNDEYGSSETERIGLYPDRIAELEQAVEHTFRIKGLSNTQKKLK